MNKPPRRPRLAARPATLAALFLAVSGPLPTRAETVHACTGFVTSVPTTITAQGVWCMRQDLSTSLSSGAAIAIAANNVTLDCNGFKLGGLSAGDASSATGIHANGRNNVTVRNCNIRGFLHGVHLTSDGDYYASAGHLVEDNRFDNNLYAGIWITGENNVVRRNRVFDTGGAPGRDASYGIVADAELVGNTVRGVFATAANTYPSGIYAAGPGQVRDNLVSGLQVAGNGHATGIQAAGPYSRASGNHVIGAAQTLGYGIYGAGDTFCSDNTVARFATAAFHQCRDSGGNDSL